MYIIQVSMQNNQRDADEEKHTKLTEAPGKGKQPRRVGEKRASSRK
jgi:hypothetical protein